MKATKIHLGCGTDYKEGWVNVDRSKNVKADIYHDLDEIPYPLVDNSAQTILMNHVLEHLENIPEVMEELYRILQPDGTLVITVPYYNSMLAFNDPTHKHFFTLMTMEYFCQGKYNYYSDARFRIVKKKLIPFPWAKLIPNIPVIKRKGEWWGIREIMSIFISNIGEELSFELRKLNTRRGEK